MEIDPKLIDSLLAEHGKRPQDIAGENGWLKQLTKAILERALNAELTDHLGYQKHNPAGYKSGNSRNGKTSKTLKGDFGEMELETPRDRNATFEPQIVAKNQTRFTGFDDKILSLYARGMSTREIEAHLEEIYGVNVSPTLISTVTEAVQEEVRVWQNRPLEALVSGLPVGACFASVISDPLYGCAVCKDAAQRTRRESCRACGNRCEYGRREGSTGAVDGVE
jgi:putative transposase